MHVVVFILYDRMHPRCDSTKLSLIICLHACPSFFCSVLVTPFVTIRSSAEVDQRRVSGSVCVVGAALGMRDARYPWWTKDEARGDSWSLVFIDHEPSLVSFALRLWLAIDESALFCYANLLVTNN